MTLAVETATGVAGDGEAGAGVEGGSEVCELKMLSVACANRSGFDERSAAFFASLLLESDIVELSDLGFLSTIDTNAPLGVLAGLLIPLSRSFSPGSELTPVCIDVSVSRTRVERTIGFGAAETGTLMIAFFGGAAGCSRLVVGATELTRDSVGVVA